MSTVDRLATLATLGEIPREQLEWLEEHGELLSFHDGSRFYRQYEDLDGLFVMLAGRFSVRVDQDGNEREVREVAKGQISGVLPYSRVTTPRGFLVADGPVELLLIPSHEIREMTRECYDFTALCVHAMLERVRRFKALDKQMEKMAALGRLSAGMAHELNNPASAVAQAARELNGSRKALVDAARELGALELAGPEAEVVERLEALASQRPDTSRSALDQSDVEDRFREWLDEANIDATLAYALAGTAVTVDDIDTVTGTLGAAQLQVVLKYLAANAATRMMAADITSAAERIHSLVAAVKKHTHMDRAPTVEPIQLRDHLADTVTLMSSKAVMKQVSLRLAVEPDLPAVVGTVAELNQVWMQLVDNAVDAAPESGVVSIEARRDDGGVLVQVIDNGPGIPRVDRERVFEPFFTTKGIGQGRGLGLDIVQTVVRNHKGTVDHHSEPGRTEFRVTLPVSDGTTPV